MSKAKSAKKSSNYIVENLTELLSGLAKGSPLKEPVKKELIKASAAMVEKKLAGSK
ncbi:MAG: hypothetical protein M1167_02295 [Chloroflexi bacterium]|nr:hypothetical protein [Chloroflexota bacterium]MCL5949653.1 hypothetical protein [Candidatus Bathyarchaeota archaeon]